MDLIGLERDWAQDRASWKGLTCGNRPTRSLHGKMDENDDDDDFAIFTQQVFQEQRR